MKKIFILFTIIILFLFAFASCIQERMMFHPEKLPADFVYNFSVPFEEINYQPEKGVTINALHFKAAQSKGVIYYLHGNAGSLKDWGVIGSVATEIGYDLLIIDYRTFGKSKGRISEKGIYRDVQFIYNKLKEKYPEEKITVYGRSIGTGIAAYVAANNNPRRLILETPYYNMRDLAKSLYPAAPTFILRYHFRTDKYLQKVKCPVYLFHGTEDKTIYYESSIKLRKFFKPGDTLFTVPGGRHNDLAKYNEFKQGLKHALQ